MPFTRLHTAALFQQFQSSDMKFSALRKFSSSLKVRPSKISRFHSSAHQHVVRACRGPSQQQIRDTARFAVDKFLQPGHVVGLGTGVIVNAVLEEIAQKIDSGGLEGIRCVPASKVTASEAAFHGVPLTHLPEAGGVDVFLEAADELDGTDPGLGFVVGRVSQQKQLQPELLRGRQLAAAAATCVALVDDADKVVSRLGSDLPVLVKGEGWEDIGEELDDIFIGDADIWRRSSEAGAGPRGGDKPYTTEEGHHILDIRFYDGLKLFGENVRYEEISMEIEGVEGVIAHGLYAGVASAAIIVGDEGPIELSKGQPLTLSMEE